MHYSVYEKTSILNTSSDLGVQLLEWTCTFFVETNRSFLFVCVRAHGVCVCVCVCVCVIVCACACVRVCVRGARNTEKNSLVCVGVCVSLEKMLHNKICARVCVEKFFV